MASPNQHESSMLTPREAEAMLGVSRRTLQRMEDQGVIKSRRLPSNHRRFVRSEVEALIGASS